MNLNNFTIKSQEALEKAEQLASAEGQQAIENGHLLLALLQTDENVVPYVLKKVNVNVEQLTNQVSELVKQYPKVSGGSIHSLSFYHLLV